MRQPYEIQDENKVRFINRLTRKNATNKNLVADYAIGPKQQIINQTNRYKQDIVQRQDVEPHILDNLNRIIIDLQSIPGDAGELVKAWSAIHPDDENYQKPHTLSNANLDELLVDLLLRGHDVDLHDDIQSMYDTVVFAYTTYQDQRVFSIEPHKCPLHLSFVPIEKLTEESLMRFEQNGFSGQYPLSEIRFINDNASHDNILHDYHVRRDMQNIQTTPYETLKQTNLI